MKCKVTSSVSHAKPNKNEANVLRRSSRRATIERRVWAVPKKPSKPGTSAKGKCAPKTDKKGRKTQTQTKVQIKNLSKSHPQQNIKRVHSATEESGNSRRKIKKTEGTKDVGTDGSGTSEVPSEPVSKRGKKLSGDHSEKNLESDDGADFRSQKRWGYTESSLDGQSVDTTRNTRSEGKVNTSRRTEWCGGTSSESTRGNSLDALCYAVEKYGGRDVEETLLTDDVCLHKVVIEEVVTDYRISESNCDVKDLDVEHKVREDIGHKDEYRDAVDILDSFHSKTGECDKGNSEKLLTKKNESIDVVKVKSPVLEVKENSSDGTSIESIFGEEGVQEVKDTLVKDELNEGESYTSVQEGLSNVKDLSCNEDSLQRQENLCVVRDKLQEGRSSTVKDVKSEGKNLCSAIDDELCGVHSCEDKLDESISRDKELAKDQCASVKVKSGKHGKETKEKQSENTCNIDVDEEKKRIKDGTDSENTEEQESDSGVEVKTASNIPFKNEGMGVVPTNTEAAAGEDSEEDHVSLALALAQLVNSECGGEVEGAETVTIHSASSVDHLEDEAGVVTLGCKAEEVDRTESPCPAEEDDMEEEEEEEEGELIIKEEDEDEIGDESEEEEFITELKQNNKEDDSREETESKDPLPVTVPERITDQLDCLVEMGGEEEDKNARSRSGSPPPQPPPQKSRKQLPPLIKISSRPPAIKTPLKCPECPMQFCTVRSLLWHFGTHGARSRDTCIPPILLQDLIVPWDKPTVSVFISQPTESATATPTSSVADNAIKIDVVSKPDVPSTIQLVRTEDYMGNNGDVILKVPIPRLKPKSHSNQYVKKDKFVNILPKIPTGDGQVSGQSTQASPQPALIRPSGSPTPQITVHPQPAVQSTVSIPSDQASTTQSQVPKITIRASNKLQIQPLASSQSTVQVQSPSAVQVQPPSLQVQPQSAVQLQQSTVQVQPQSGTQLQQPSAVAVQSQSALQVQTPTGVQVQPSPALQVQPIVTTSKGSSAAPSHITLIPMDKLTAVGQTINPRGSKLNPAPLRMVAPSTMPVKSSNTVDNVLEKDGLVMINSNLALRIVSSLPSSLDSATNTTNTTTLRPIASQSTNNLTIVPQTESNKLINSSKIETAKSPDILTIVPQVDLNKKVSLLKSGSSVSGGQVASASPKQPSTAQSQVVKLYLLQPKDPKANGGSLKSGITSEASNVNGIEIPLPLPNGNEKLNYREVEVKDNTSESSEGEEEEEEEEEDDDDEGMVIDDGKEGEDDVMDPLSLCAVTMEDENLEALNNASQTTQSGGSSPATSPDKVIIKKLPVRPKGKNGQAVDIVKYEARKYVCCYCNRRFGWSTDLKRHVILHTGEKPFQCKVCPTAFTRKFLLQNHMKRMHPDKCKMSDLWP
ncbi:uncharacterized protein LOC134766157 [Penaeus indicus]|uniref:uncharacterized protein LOC134766157 n=1 Tax=Penaeus indicus TaxID=29960 RepID=UPI00300C747F